jgi:hypothetical protein
MFQKLAAYLALLVRLGFHKERDLWNNIFAEFDGALIKLIEEQGWF